MHPPPAQRESAEPESTYFSHNLPPIASPIVGSMEDSTSLIWDKGSTPQRSLSHGPNIIQRVIIPSLSKPVLRGVLPPTIWYWNCSPKSSSSTRIDEPMPYPTGLDSHTSRAWSGTMGPSLTSSTKMDTMPYPLRPAASDTRTFKSKEDWRSKFNGPCTDNTPVLLSIENSGKLESINAYSNVSPPSTSWPTTAPTTSKPCVTEIPVILMLPFVFFKG